MSGCYSSPSSNEALDSFAVGKNAFLLNGDAFQIICGEIHFARVPQPYWRHRLKMAKAMGLNTVCCYLFWNYHETEPGLFDFSGEKDVGAFCSLAAELDLKVILRPGPYACAEWDFGGLPAYLLKDPGMQLRSSYPGFLEPACKFLHEVGSQLARHQITRGGNIILVQIENEYGVYGNDRQYLHALKSTLREAGFDVPFMRCDWAIPAHMKPGEVDDSVVTVANFGSNAKANITALQSLYPGQPSMCGEFWLGWFDWFGYPRNGGGAENGEPHLSELKWMLQNDVSFSLYMFHGGTTFGFYPGANNEGGKRYDPYVTSYDYFAPINEQGRARPKYYRFREAISEARGIELPEPPEPLPVAAIPPFAMTESAALLLYPTAQRQSPGPLNMEALDQWHGCILYRTDLTGRCAGTDELRIRDVHDYAWVYLNGKLIKRLNRQLPEQGFLLTIPEQGPAVLEILVEALGRVNFGPTMQDEIKGVTRRVEFGRLILLDWQIEQHPLNAEQLNSLPFRQEVPEGDYLPRFFRGHFETKEPADTFLDMRGWGKGYVWVNGRMLGRFWRVGPQQTLYLPGVWQQCGENEVVVLDLHNEPGGRCRLVGLTEPILDQNETELNADFAVEVPHCNG